MKTSLNDQSQGKQAFAKVAAVILILSMLLVGSAGPAYADGAITFNLVQEIPVVYSQYIPCAAAGVGEVLDFSGSLKMTIHGTLTEDGLATFSAKMVPNNLIGVGQTSGDTYRLVGETGATHTYSIELGTDETWTGTEHFSFIAPGAGNDYVTLTVFHKIVNSNGYLIDFKEWTNAGCR